MPFAQCRFDGFEFGPQADHAPTGALDYPRLGLIFAASERARSRRVAAKKILTPVFRAFRALRKTGVIVIPRPIPDASKRAGSWNLRWEVFQDLLIETVKIVYYGGRGWI